MASTTVIPGPRDVRASVDAPDEADPGAPETAVVALPPHPQLGGSRSDTRLRAVSTALTSRGITCCRVDYGPWAGGDGEVDDARSAIEWADDRYEAVGCFGYSFGAGVAICAATEGAPSPTALAALAPPAGVGDDLDVETCLETVGCPVGLWHGTDDRTVDWDPVVDRAETLGHEVSSYPGGHHVTPHTDDVADEIGEFFDDRLDEA